jgi:PST family polysaccharide transporter
MSAGRWSITSYAISQGIASLLYLPLARLLTPEDFGLVAAASLVSTGLILVCEASLTRALIRLPGNRDELAQATLVLSIIAGVIGGALCALAGPPMARIFGEERLTLVLVLLAPGVLFSSLGTVPQAILARNLDFRRKTLPETVSVTVGGIAAIAAAALGAGVFSLIIYTVARLIVGTLVAWRVAGWRPKLRRPRWEAMRRILGFGLPASGGDLALYARLNCDYAITGRALGTDRLGIYTLAWSAGASPAALITSFFGGVGYATFARLQNDRAQLRAMYLSATRLIASIALPLFVGAVFIRQELVDTLYGSRWQDMVGPLVPLFLLHGVREVCRPGAALTLATGHNRIYMLCGTAMLPLTVVAVLVGSRYGITGVSWAMLIAVGGASLVWPTIAVIVLRPGPARLWRTARVPLLLTALSAPVVFGVDLLLSATSLPAVVRLALPIAAGFAAFCFGLLLCRTSLEADIRCLRKNLPADEPAAEETVTTAAEPVEVPLARPIPAVVAVPSIDG